MTPFDACEMTRETCGLAPIIPVLVVNDFIDGGADVTLSGIDANVALIRTGQRADAGETLWAVPYDFIGACDEAPDICLGVPYFNWGPAYLGAAQEVIDGNFTADWNWYEPNWADINDPDESVVGYFQGNGLSADSAASLDTFIADPQSFAPGSVMTSAQGVSDHAIRSAIIDYLKTQ